MIHYLDHLYDENIKSRYIKNIEDKEKEDKEEKDDKEEKEEKEDKEEKKDIKNNTPVKTDICVRIEMRRMPLPIRNYSCQKRFYNNYINRLCLELQKINLSV